MVTLRAGQIRSPGNGATLYNVFSHIKLYLGRDRSLLDDRCRGTIAVVAANEAVDAVQLGAQRALEHQPRQLSQNSADGGRTPGMVPVEASSCHLFIQNESVGRDNVTTMHECSFHSLSDAPQFNFVSKKVQHFGADNQINTLWQFVSPQIELSELDVVITATTIRGSRKGSGRDVGGDQSLCTRSQLLGEMSFCAGQLQSNFHCARR